MNAPVTQEGFADRVWGPELELGPTLDQQVEWLDNASRDPEAYCRLWQASIVTVGGYVTLSDHSDDPLALGIGRICDRYMAERGARIDALVHHLDQTGHRETLVRHLYRAAVAEDRATTAALRDYLRTQGRVFITPKGELIEGGGIPAALIDEDDPEVWAKFGRISRAYHRARSRTRGRRHIIRAVRMLGKLDPGSGCIVLDARAETEEVPA